MSRRLVDLLLNDRIIPQPQYDEAMQAAQSGKNHVRYLIEKGYLSETKLLYYLSRKFGLPSINLDKFEIKPEIIQLMRPELVRKTQTIPIQANNGTVVVALCDPTFLPEVESLKFQLKSNIESVLTSFSAFDRALTKYFGGAINIGETFEKYHKNKAKEQQTDFEVAQVVDIDSDTSSDDAPVITLVNGILSEALKQGASDIHVEPYEAQFRVRMRVDGVLKKIMDIPTEMRRAVIARLKIMSQLDIAETRVPQDGRIKLKASGKEIDFRVNSMPTLFGEKVVMRLLDKTNLQLDLKKLGFDQKQLEVFRKGIYSSNGMVLVTGPTGSGKTTTLYSALTELNKVTENLSTVEDPVEYNLNGINQVQTHRDIGLTFSAVLRALLRQDPDVILVGEIRDYETAEVAIQAALTGHLVLSTLHTNDAASTLIRLMNMGVEAFLVTSSVNTIVAQRLVRKLCSKCKKPTTYPTEKLIEVGIPQATIEQAELFEPVGCRFCNDQGYRGRIAIYEILDFTADLKEMVLSGSTSAQIKKKAIENGMLTLRMSALSKAIEGLTSLEEALSKTMEG